MKNILFILALSFLITSCNKSVKKTLGLTEDLPDEFQVKKNQPLEMPPHFNPTHSIKGPQEKKPAKNLSKAAEAMLDETVDKK